VRIPTAHDVDPCEEMIPMAPSLWTIAFGGVKMPLKVQG
jgi:hypothetical protein